MMNIPSLFDVNVTASSTISIGVVRHRIYLTSSLKISETQKSRMNLRLFQAQRTMKFRTQSLKGTSKSFYSLMGLLGLGAKKLNIAWKNMNSSLPFGKADLQFCLPQASPSLHFSHLHDMLGPLPMHLARENEKRKAGISTCTGQPDNTFFEPWKVTYFTWFSFY